MRQCFVSYATADRAFVEEEVVATLDAIGVETWYCQTDVRTSAEWQREIFDALNAADWFVVILSPQSIASEWVKNEVAWAFTNRVGRIIPVLIEECETQDLHLKSTASPAHRLSYCVQSQAKTNPIGR